MARQNVADAVADGDSDEAEELRYTATELGKLRIKYDSLRDDYSKLHAKHADLEERFTQVCREGAGHKDKLFLLHDIIDDLTIKVDDLMQGEA